MSDYQDNENKFWTHMISLLSAVFIVLIAVISACAVRVNEQQINMQKQKQDFIERVVNENRGKAIVILEDDPSLVK